MAHTGDHFTDILASGEIRAMPRVAYTYGDVQPVRSTYIAHDPFFFADISDQLLEEELMRELEENLDADLDGEFETFLKEFREELKSDRSLKSQSSEKSMYEESSVSLKLFEDFDETAAFHSASKQNIINTLQRLEKSRFSQALIEYVQDHKINMIECNKVFSAEFCARTQTILFNPYQNDIDFLMSIFVVLRKAWQHIHGAGIHPLSLYPDHAIMVHRAQSADLAICLLRTGWELSLAGDHDVWEHLENKILPDIAHSFARDAASDFRSLNDGRAHFSAFEAWFLSDRSRTSDRELIQMMLSEYTGHSFTDEDMSQLVVLDMIRALGHMPYGKNYLEPEISALVSDPIFSEVRERSTSNFLWFIKFEKSFREMEQSLQPDEQNLSATFPGRTSASRTSSGDLYEHAEQTQKTGDIIAFPKPFRKPDRLVKRKQFNGAQSHQDAEVIPFDIINRPFNTTFT